VISPSVIRFESDGFRGVEFGDYKCYSQLPHTRQDYVQGENAITYLQANKIHTTSIQDQEKPRKIYIGRGDTSTHNYNTQTKI
jgi:hypothetical protein